MFVESKTMDTFIEFGVVGSKIKCPAFKNINIEGVILCYIIVDVQQFISHYLIPLKPWVKLHYDYMIVLKTWNREEERFFSFYLLFGMYIQAIHTDTGMIISTGTRLSKSEILRDKTMDDNFIYIPNDAKQNWLKV